MQITVGGHPAFKITFQNEISAGQPMVIVYSSGYVYEIVYATNLPAGSTLDNNGLAAFDEVLHNFTFNN
jgi:hypothetical protein